MMRAGVAAVLAGMAVLAAAPARAQAVPPALPRPPAAARQPALVPEPREAPAPTAADRAVAITMDQGAGRLVRLPSPALTVLAADPRIARVQPASPTSLFIMAVAAGRTTIVATAEDGSKVAEYDVTVQGPVAEPAAPATPPPAGAGTIQSMIRRMVRGAESVTVRQAGRMLVLSGTVPSAADAARAEAVARAYAGEDRDVTNEIGLLSSIQVNLRVRVAEISRQVTRELGFNWQALANDGANWVIGLRTGNAGRVASAITGAAGTTATSSQVGRYGLGFNSSRFDINAVVDALAADQLITVLAEPNLTAQSGEVASFLAGGEFPVPVAASSVTNTITIEFKQFGVSLAFVPTVLGPDRLNLRVRPEVSELSQNGAISLPLSTGVVTIPALNVRRAETTIELGSGQSFAIAGLLQRGSTINNSGITGLGDIPVLGALFRSDRFQRNETELVIIITPYLVRPVSDPRELVAPTDGVRPATDLDRVLYRRQIARGAPAPQLRGRLDAGFILE